MFECRTLVPKMGVVDAHKLASIAGCYEMKCYLGMSKEVAELEIKLRQYIYKARQQLAKQQEV